MRPRRGLALIAVVTASLALPVASRTPPVATQATNPQSASSGASDQQPGIVSFDAYRKALGEERQILERQSDRQFSSVNQTVDRAITIFSSLVGVGVAVLSFAAILFVYFFGRTHREFRKTMGERFDALAQEVVEREAVRLRQKTQDLQEQIDDLAAFKSAQVVWIMPEGSGRFEEEQVALRSAGVMNLNIVTPPAGEMFSVGSANLCILSFDGTDEGRRVLAAAVEQLKQKSPPVPLLVYTYSHDAKEIRLGAPELEILSGFLWFVPVNFPAQLLAQTQVLNRRARVFAEGVNGLR